MKVAVTGASGLVGSALCPVLSGAGHEVMPIDLRRDDASHLRGAQAVVHLAAIAHRRARTEDLRRVNVELPTRVGQAAAACGASMVFLSSVKVHGETSQVPFREDSALSPQDPYGDTKARAEEALRAIPDLRLTVLRPPLVYGPGVKANFLAMMAAIARGWPLPLASVRNRRSLIYAGNLAHAIVACLEREGTYLVSDGAPVSTPELCNEIGCALERAARLFTFPQVLLPAKLAGSLEIDDAAIRRALGWAPPFSRAEGLRATARWYQGR